MRGLLGAYTCSMNKVFPAGNGSVYSFQGEVATTTFASQDASQADHKPVVEKKTRLVKLWTDAEKQVVVHLDGHTLTLVQNSDKEGLRWHHQERDEFSSLTVDVYLSRDKVPKQISIRKTRVIADRKTEIHFTGSCLPGGAALLVN